MLELKPVYPVVGSRAAMVKSQEAEAYHKFENQWLILNESLEVLNLENCPTLNTVEFGLDSTHLTMAVKGMFLRLALDKKPSRLLPQAESYGFGTLFLEPDLYSQLLSQHLGQKVFFCRK